MVPDGFRLPESRPAALDNSLRSETWSVSVRLGMAWFEIGGLITR